MRPWIIIWKCTLGLIRRIQCGAFRIAADSAPGLGGVAGVTGLATAGFRLDTMGDETSPSSGTDAAFVAAAAAALAEGDVTTVQGCAPLDSSDAVDVSTSECSSPRCITADF